jgi:hypothetical protein
MQARRRTRTAVLQMQQPVSLLYLLTSVRDTDIESQRTPY